MERVKDRGGSFGPGQALIYIANDAKPAVINLHNGCCARERTVRICLGGDWIGRSFRINDAVFHSLSLPSVLVSLFASRWRDNRERKRKRGIGRYVSRRELSLRRSNGISAHATRTSRAHLEEIYERRQSADEQITSSRYNARFFIGRVVLPSLFQSSSISVERKAIILCVEIGEFSSLVCFAFFFLLLLLFSTWTEIIPQISFSKLLIFYGTSMNYSYRQQEIR